MNTISLAKWEIAVGRAFPQAFVLFQDDRFPIKPDLQAEAGDYVAALGADEPNKVVAVFSPSKATARVGEDTFVAVPDVVMGVRGINSHEQRFFIKTGDGGFTFREELDESTLTPSELAEYRAEPDPWPFGYESGPVYPNPVFRSLKAAMRYARLNDEAISMHNEMAAFGAPAECAIRLFDRIELEQERLTDLFLLNV